MRYPEKYTIRTPAQGCKVTINSAKTQTKCSALWVWWFSFQATHPSQDHELSSPARCIIHLTPSLLCSLDAICMAHTNQSDWQKTHQLKVFEFREVDELFHLMDCWRQKKKKKQVKDWWQTFVLRVSGGCHTNSPEKAPQVFITPWKERQTHTCKMTKLVVCLKCCVWIKNWLQKKDILTYQIKLQHTKGPNLEHLQTHHCQRNTGHELFHPIWCYVDSFFCNCIVNSTSHLINCS